MFPELSQEESNKNKGRMLVEAGSGFCPILEKVEDSSYQVVKSSSRTEPQKQVEVEDIFLCEL